MRTKITQKPLLPGVSKGKEGDYERSMRSFTKTLTIRVPSESKGDWTLTSTVGVTPDLDVEFNSIFRDDLNEKATKAALARLDSFHKQAMAGILEFAPKANDEQLPPPEILSSNTGMFFFLFQHTTASQVNIKPDGFKVENMVAPKLHIDSRYKEAVNHEAGVKMVAALNAFIATARAIIQPQHEEA